MAGKFGWDYSDLICQTEKYISPTEAMTESNNFKIPKTNWVLTMITFEDGIDIEEQIIDTSILSL